MKVCLKCGESKPLGGFQKHRTARDGHRNVCRECNCAQMRAQYEAHKEERKARQKRWYEAHREDEIRKRREFRARESEQINAQRKARRDADPEHRKRVDKAWRERNRDRLREYNARHKYRRRDINIAALLERDEGRCGICAEELGDNFHIDHIVPRIRGGSSEMTNLQLACPSCNLRKGARPVPRHSALASLDSVSVAAAA